jgi:hypothetical protein
MRDAALLTPQTLAPPHRDHARAPHAALYVTMGTVGIPAWTARHRPPPELSPRRQTRLNPLDQFLEPAPIETDRATQLDASEQARACRVCRLFSCACTPSSFAQHTFTHGIESQARRHPHPAPQCTDAPPPHPILLATSLKPCPF